MDWSFRWCFQRDNCNDFDCLSDHELGAESIHDIKDVRFRSFSKLSHFRRRLLLLQHHSHMPSSPSASLEDKAATMADASTHSSTQSTDVRQLHVHGSINTITVTAIPDFGSGFDIMSAETAQLHGLPINRQQAHSYTLPSGKVKQFLGTVTAQWRFSGETTPYTRTFHILQGCVHPVILGKEFLRATETFSRHVRRIKVAIVRSIRSIRRLLLVDHFKSITQTNERMLGLINGRPVPGFADTCSDISIIKRSVARTLGLNILEGPAHRIEVEFVDGSRAFTTGLVKDVQWCFSASLSPKDMHGVDFHIMDDIPCAVILDKWLLWDNRAFIDYSDCFFDVGIQKTAELDPVCLIQVKGSSKGVAAAIDPVEAEVARRVEEDDRIDELPPSQQVYARAAETRRRQAWDQSRLQLQGPAATTAAPLNPLAAPFVPPWTAPAPNSSTATPAQRPSPTGSVSNPSQPSPAPAAQTTAALTPSSSSSGPSSTTSSSTPASTKPSTPERGWTTVFRRKNRKK